MTATTNAPIVGSIEDLGRRLIAEANASRCVAYRRSGSGELVWQADVEADVPAAAEQSPSAVDSVRAAVMITRPVRDAFGQVIGVIQTRNE